MSTEDLPYIQTQTADGQLRLHLPVIETTAENKTLYEKVGLKPQVGITQQGEIINHLGHSIIVWQVVKYTPYTIALYNIGREEQAGKLPVGSYAEAFNLVLENEFDESSWAETYMPRQAEQ